jgi:hypothetical protein
VRSGSSLLIAVGLNPDADEVLVILAGAFVRVVSAGSAIGAIFRIACHV